MAWWFLLVRTRAAEASSAVRPRRARSRKRAASLNRSEQHLAGERQVRAGTPNTSDLGAPDFNCRVCSQLARKHAQVIPLKA
jgi:hypothetical protein